MWNRHFVVAHWLDNKYEFFYRNKANFSGKNYRMLLNGHKQNHMQNFKCFGQSLLLIKIPNAPFPPNPSIASVSLGCLLFSRLSLGWSHSGWIIQNCLDEVHWSNQWIHSSHRFIGCLDAPWFELSWTVDPDHHPKEMRISFVY